MSTSSTIGADVDGATGDGAGDVAGVDAGAPTPPDEVEAVLASGFAFDVVLDVVFDVDEQATPAIAKQIRSAV
jgi:hypothetical protein